MVEPRGFAVAKHVAPLGAALLLACTGTVLEPSGNSADGPTLGGRSCGPGPHAAEVPMRRLSREQYQNAVRDLFDGEITPSDRFPNGSGVSVTGFSTEPGVTTVDELATEQILYAAEDAALQVPDALPGLLACAADADDACAEAFIHDVGARAYRHPLHDDEHDVLYDAYRGAVEDGATFEEGLAMVVAVLLQSPQFLYVPEVGVGEDVVRLTDYEVATRLALLFWDSIPDRALLDAAREGRLSTDEEIAVQARRLLEDERSAAGTRRFFREWLGITELRASDRDPTTFPEFDEQVAASMGAGFDRYVADIVRTGDTYEALLTRDGVVVDAELAAFLGLPTDGLADGELRAMSADAPRAGIMGQPLTMASLAHLTESSYVHRGRAVVSGLLCQELGVPPANALDAARSLEGDLPPDATRRRVSEAIRSTSPCNGCHDSLDPPGLAYEHFDAVGRYRERDAHGNEIDPAGSIVAGYDRFDFADASALMAQIATSDTGVACFNAQYYRFFSSRMNARQDDCALGEMQAVAEASGGSLREMMVALTETDSFVYRRIPTEP